MHSASDRKDTADRVTVAIRMGLTRDIDTLIEKKQDVTVIFQGAGARWPIEFAKEDHVGHALYEALADRVIACGGCADVFGATEQLAPLGIKLVREKAIPGTTGVVELSRYLDAGDRLLTF